jgi:hypothetical protein
MKTNSSTQDPYDAFFIRRPKEFDPSSFTYENFVYDMTTHFKKPILPQALSGSEFLKKIQWCACTIFYAPAFLLYWVNMGCSNLPSFMYLPTSVFLHCLILPCYLGGRAVAFPIKKLRHGWNAVFRSKVVNQSNRLYKRENMSSGHQNALDSLSTSVFNKIAIKHHVPNESFLFLDALDGSFAGLQYEEGTHALLIHPHNEEAWISLADVKTGIAQPSLKEYLNEAIKTGKRHRIYVLSPYETGPFSRGILSKSLRRFLKYGV